jgi:hypothetical protein
MRLRAVWIIPVNGNVSTPLFSRQVIKLIKFAEISAGVYLAVVVLSHLEL